MVFPMRLEVLVPGCLAVTQMLYGATAVVGRVGLRASNPLAFSIWRFLLAGICLEVLLVWQQGWRSALPSRSGTLFLCAVCTVGANVGMTLGIVLSGQVTATAWQPLQLVFTTLISLTFGFEAASARKLLGLALGMAGAMLIVFLDPGVWNATSQKQHSGPQGWGHFALFVNTLSACLSILMRRRLTRESGFSPLQVVAWTHVVAVPILVFFGLAGNQSVSFRAAACAGCDSVTAPPTSSLGWMALAFYTVVPTMICQSLNTWASAHAEPTMMAMFPVLQPVASASLSWMLRLVMPGLRDTLLPPQLNMLGGLPVLLGLWFVSRDAANPKRDRRD